MEQATVTESQVYCSNNPDESDRRFLVLGIINLSDNNYARVLSNKKVRSLIRLDRIGKKNKKSYTLLHPKRCLECWELVFPCEACK